MSIKRNLIYNNIFVLLDLAFPVLVFPYVARVLGPESLGIVNFAYYIGFYFLMIGSFGINLYGIRETAKIKDNPIKRSILFSELSTILFFSSIGSYILYILFFILTKPNIPLRLELVIGMLLLYIPFSFDWFFAGLENYKYLALRSLVIKVFSALFIFILVKNQGDYTTYHGVIIFFSGLGVLANVLFVRKYISFSIKNLNLTKHIKPAIILLVGYASYTLYTFLDSVMLAYLSTNECVGYYVPGMKIVRVFISGITTLGTVLIPRVSQYISENKKDEVYNLTQKNLSFIMFFSTISLVLLYFFIPEIILLFAGNKYNNTISSTRILSPILIFSSINFLCYMQLLLPKGKEKYMFIISIIGIIVALISNFIFIPIYKHNGAAVSILITEIIVLLFSIYFVKRFYQFNILKFSYLKYLVSGAIAIVFLIIAKKYLFFDNDFINMPIFGLITIIIYSSLLYTQKEFTIIKLLTILKKVE